MAELVILCLKRTAITPLFKLSGLERKLPTWMYIDFVEDPEEGLIAVLIMFDLTTTFDVIYRPTLL